MVKILFCADYNRVVLEVQNSSASVDEVFDALKKDVVKYLDLKFTPVNILHTFLINGIEASEASEASETSVTSRYLVTIGKINFEKEPEFIELNSGALNFCSDCITIVRHNNSVVENVVSIPIIE